MVANSADERSEDLMRHIVNGIRDAVALTDLKGEILEVNPAFLRMYGYSKDELIGKPVSILKSGRHDDTFYSHLWHSIRHGMVWEGHIYNKRRDGSVVMVEVSISGLFDQQGLLEYYLASMREHVSYAWQSETGQRLAADHEAMTACLAHDLSNLVTPILGNAGTAMKKIDNGDVPRAEVEAISKSAHRAKELVRQVLAFCRHEYGGRKDPIALDHIIQDVVSMLEADLPKNVTLKSIIVHKNMMLPAEPVQMHQVLLNLCNNSISAMEAEGGALKITLESVIINDNSPYLGDLDQGIYVKVSVIDDGVGMDLEGQRRAFDPFFSSRSKADGHGLGLSIARKIVENHMGRIYLKSKVGKGCQVDVLLPTGASISITETQQIPVSVVPVVSGTIMLVDDEHSILQMGKNMLEYAGYSVIGLSGSQQALECFQKQPKDFDLIVLDYVMPGMNGFDLAKVIREIRKDVPIIFITGHAQQFPESEFKALKNCRLLPKPFSSDELLAMVSELNLI